MHPILPHTKLTIFTLLMLTALGSAADNTAANRSGTLAKPSVSSEYFLSETKAVAAAADAFNPRSIAEDREFIGGIYRCAENRYRYSVTPGKRGSGKARIALRKIPGCKVTALWHTHGNANSRHRYFSDTDTRVANALKMPFYLADYTGHLKVFTPGARTLTPFTARQYGLGTHPGYAIGERVKNAHGKPITVATTREPQNAPLGLSAEIGY